MDYISVMGVTELVARERILADAGYTPATIGRVVLIADSGDNSRQKTFVFETSNDVTLHPDYAKARLSDTYDLSTLQHADGVEDGPVLVYGPEVTVGG